MRFGKTRPLVSGLPFVGLLVFLACGPVYGQVGKAPDKKASLPAVEKDLPYADGRSGRRGHRDTMHGSAPLSRSR
jgi:hypothetical protein